MVPTCGRDALEFIAVGAVAVQVGTMSFMRPRAATEVVEEITAFLAQRGIRRLGDWRGCLMEGAGVGGVAPIPGAARRERGGRRS
jgi:dihydroorotate dehydrogenase (NAD+) catalytic subunit